MYVPLLAIASFIMRSSITNWNIFELTCLVTESMRRTKMSCSWRAPRNAIQSIWSQRVSSLKALRTHHLRRVTAAGTGCHCSSWWHPIPSPSRWIQWRPSARFRSVVQPDHIRRSRSERSSTCANCWAAAFQSGRGQCPNCNGSKK